MTRVIKYQKLNKDYLQNKMKIFKNCKIHKKFKNKVNLK